MDAGRLSLTTADGLTLEAEVVPAAGAAPVAAAVLCHPHPLYGGSMHNNVVDRLLADLPPRGVTALRFNFRGTGRSEGTHGGGEAEQADVVAALNALAAAEPEVPLLVAGYSFGADVALSLDDDRLAGRLAVSPPLGVIDPTVMAAATDPRPTVIVTGTADAFRPPDGAAEVTAGWPTTEVRASEGTDHFWMRGLDAVTEAAETLLARLG